MLRVPKKIDSNRFLYVFEVCSGDFVKVTSSRDSKTSVCYYFYRLLYHFQQNQFDSFVRYPSLQKKILEKILAIDWKITEFCTPFKRGTV